jgi:hypothetical protein
VLTYVIGEDEKKNVNKFKGLNCDASDEDEDEGHGSDNDANDHNNDDDEDNDNDDDNIKYDDQKSNKVGNTAKINIPRDMDFNPDVYSDPDNETRVTNQDEVVFDNNGKKISKKKLKLMAMQNASSAPAAESGSSERSKVLNDWMLVVMYLYIH